MTLFRVIVLEEVVVPVPFFRSEYSMGTRVAELENCRFMEPITDLAALETSLLVMVVPSRYTRTDS